MAPGSWIPLECGPYAVQGAAGAPRPRLLGCAGAAELAMGGVRSLWVAQTHRYKQDRKQWSCLVSGGTSGQPNCLPCTVLGFREILSLVFSPELRVVTWVQGQGSRGLFSYPQGACAHIETTNGVLE